MGNQGVNLLASFGDMRLSLGEPERRERKSKIQYFNIFYFVLLMKSHLQSYPCPLQINFFWNLGFLLGITIILQIVTGIFLALHYTSDLNSAYSSVFFFIREIYYGWCLRYLHSSGASFVFLFLTLLIEELYFMVHTFIIQILGFLELLFFYS